MKKIRVKKCKIERVEGIFKCIQIDRELFKYFQKGKFRGYNVRNVGEVLKQSRGINSRKDRTA